jgi:hypothetical protein
MLCYNPDAQSALAPVVTMEEGNGHIPAVLCTALLPSLLILFFVTHYDLLLQIMFEIIKLVVCCHEGRGSKMAEVCAFRQILPFYVRAFSPQATAFVRM